MHPRWYFVLKAALAFTGTVFIVLTLLYLMSFIVFILRHNGVLLVPSFGLRGMQVFLLSLPWLLITLSVVFLIILELLVKQYAFAYRRPLVYSICGMLLLVTAGGLVIAMTPLHPGLFQQAREDKLPFAGPFYRQFVNQRLNDVHKGVLLEFVNDGFFIRNYYQEKLRVIVRPSTQFPYEQEFSVGEWVLVFGQRQDGTIEALGVRKIDDLIEHFKIQGPPHRLRP